MNLIDDDDLKYSEATEEWVTGISSIEEVAPGVIRVTYYSQHGDAWLGETVRRRVVHHQIWHIAQWTAATLAAHGAWKAMQGVREYRMDPKVVAYN